MCELYSLDQTAHLKEVETYCSLMYPKMGRSHCFSATVSNQEYQINQCAEKVFLSIESQNIYMRIAQRYTTIQHDTFGCSVRSFLTLLGCVLHFVIRLIEEKLSRRNIIKGIQESFEILMHLYRCSAINIDERLSFTLENKPGEYIWNRINKYISRHFQVDEVESQEDSYTVYVKSCTERLCHYDSVTMKESLWLLVQDFLMLPANDDPLAKALLNTDSVNPIKSIGVILTQTFNPSGTDDLTQRFRLFKEASKNLNYLVCTQPATENGKEFSICPGILLVTQQDTAALLDKFVGLRNCLLFNCDIHQVSHITVQLGTLNQFQWMINIINRIKMAQANCILLCGTCDESLKYELQHNMEISVIETVPRRALEIISTIMDVDVDDAVDSEFTVIQLLVSVLPLTTLDSSILCSVQVPKWMEIFGVTYVNLKTVLIRHPSVNVAQALFESFQHNYRRIENALTMGCFLNGGGTLETKFAHELKARADDMIINNVDSEMLEQKCRTMSEVAKALELYHFHVHHNLVGNCIDQEVDLKFDDLESKIGCVDILCQCLTALCSTDVVIRATMSDNCTSGTNSP